MMLWCYDFPLIRSTLRPLPNLLIANWMNRSNKSNQHDRQGWFPLTFTITQRYQGSLQKKKGNCNSMLSDNARLPGFHVELSLQVQIHSDDDFYSSTKHFPKIWGLGMGCTIIIIIIGMQINLFWTSLPFCVHFLQEETARSTFIKQRPHPSIFCTNRHQSQWVQSICW